MQNVFYKRLIKQTKELVYLTFKKIMNCWNAKMVDGGGKNFKIFVWRVIFNPKTIFYRLTPDDLKKAPNPPNDT